jgi:hypothetical protein
VRLALLSCDFTVHQPVELIDHVRRLGARFTGAVHPGKRGAAGPPGRVR